MDDLISRQAALKVACDTCQFVSCPDDDKCDEYEAMKNLPSADRKGHWIAEPSDKILGQLNWSCSECGERFALDIGKCPSDIGMNFCTNCGADMRGEEK